MILRKVSSLSPVFQGGKRLECCQIRRWPNLGNREQVFPRPEFAGYRSSDCRDGRDDDRLPSVHRTGDGDSVVRDNEEDKIARRVGRLPGFYREGYNLPARISGSREAEDAQPDGYLKRATAYSRDEETDFALDRRLSARLASDNIIT